MQLKATKHNFTDVQSSNALQKVHPMLQYPNFHKSESTHILKVLASCFETNIIVYFVNTFDRVEMFCYFFWNGDKTSLEFHKI